MRAPHSPLVPIVEPPMTRREQVALVVVLAVGLAAAVGLLTTLVAGALWIARMVGGG